MEKENWFQRLYTKKRFWGGVAVTVGGLMQLIPIPIISAVGIFLVKGGSILAAAGFIDKADSVKKEKAAQQGSSDQK